MTKRIISVALAAGAAVAFAVPGTANAVMCTDRPIEDCAREWLALDEAVNPPCIPTGDLEDPCRW